MILCPVCRRGRGVFFARVCVALSDATNKNERHENKLAGKNLTTNNSSGCRTLYGGLPAFLLPDRGSNVLLEHDKVALAAGFLIIL